MNVLKSWFAGIGIAVCSVGLPAQVFHVQGVGCAGTQNNPLWLFGGRVGTSIGVSQGGSAFGNVNLMFAATRLGSTVTLPGCGASWECSLWHMPAGATVSIPGPPIIAQQTAGWTLPVPNDPGLIGFTLYFQGIAYSAPCLTSTGVCGVTIF